ncbi:hypothetical protein LQZ18_04695 [Lachnospiraceae bacterium ZAX-1]
MKANAHLADINRALKSWGFIVGVVGMAVVAFFGSFEQMLPVFQGQFAETGLNEGFVVQLVFTALSSDVVLLVLPILCAIPFTSAFIDDYKSRFIRKYLPRVGKRNYVNAKVITTALSGGLTLFAGVILVLFIFAILFLPMEAPAKIPETTGYEMQMMEIAKVDGIVAQQNFAEFMTRAFVFFLCGCFWSLVGGLLATLTMSRYMAYASPFILYYMFVILSERYFKDMYVLNPQEWVNPVSDWVGGTWGVALFVTELIIAAGFLYGCIIERKLQDV